MKICSMCKIEKALTEFFSRKGSKDGVRANCKPCHYNSTVKWRQDNKEGRLVYITNWCKSNKERHAEAQAKYARTHREKHCAHQSKRRATKLKAVPKWADSGIIEALYVEARDKTRSSGMKFEVDHIVPLKHKLVCGLHTDHNLRVIPAVDNRIKGNRVWPDMP